MTDSTELPKKSPLDFWREVRVPPGAYPYIDYLALTLWVGALTQLFVYDWQGALLDQSPVLRPAFEHRFIILVVALAITWAFLGRRFPLSFLYVIGYPLIAIPRWVYRNWVILLAYSPTIVATLAAFKWHFFTFAIVLLCCFAIYHPLSNPFVIAGMGFLGSYLIAHFYRRFRGADARFELFSHFTEIVKRTTDNLHNLTIKRPEGVEPNSEEYAQQMGAALLPAYALSTGLLVVGEKFATLRRERTVDLYFCASLAYTIGATVVVFAFLYLGAETLIPRSFANEMQPGLASFLGLSFSTLTLSGVSELRPTNALAAVLMHLEVAFQIAIIFLLGFIFFTSRRERYNSELDGVLAELNRFTQKMGAYLEENADVTLAGMEAWIYKVNPKVGRWFMIRRYGEHRANELAASLDQVPTLEIVRQALPPAKPPA
jgi:hypothetical protein